jgi:hypothetical protein
MMISKKILNIQECYFILPDDFKGTLGEALSLLAEYRLNAEKENQIHTSDIDCYEILTKNNDIKCSIKYGIYELSKDNEWELIKSS